MTDDDDYDDNDGDDDDNDDFKRHAKMVSTCNYYFHDKVLESLWNTS